MITGFNTDVEHQERVFHVQTEDKGLDNPLVETLIYTGGEILTSRRASYADLLESGTYSEDELLHRMETQHQALIREIFNGTYDDGEPKPFGHSIITNRSLDEVVREFIDANVTVGPMRLELIDDQVLIEGTRPTLRLRLVDEREGDPIGGVAVIMLHTCSGGDPEELFSSVTDADGFIEGSFEIPSQPGEDAAIVCRAEVGDQCAEARVLIERARPKPRSRAVRARAGS